MPVDATKQALSTRRLCHDVGGHNRGSGVGHNDREETRGDVEDGRCDGRSSRREEGGHSCATQHGVAVVPRRTKQKPAPKSTKKIFSSMELIIIIVTLLAFAPFLYLSYVDQHHQNHNNDSSMDASANFEGGATATAAAAVDKRPSLHPLTSFHPDAQRIVQKKKPRKETKEGAISDFNKIRTNDIVLVEYKGRSYEATVVKQSDGQGKYYDVQYSVDGELEYKVRAERIRKMTRHTTGAYANCSKHHHHAKPRKPASSSHPDQKTVTVSCDTLSYRISPRRQLGKIVIGVLSAASGDGPERRASIRETWASDRHDDVYFIVAGPWEDVAEEYNEYKDLIWINREENYDSGLTYKTMAFVKIVHDLAVGTNSDVRYAFKTDDDSFINVQYLHDYLLETKRNEEYDYWGLCREHMPEPIRNVTEKWAASTELYPEPLYPRYCQGAGFALSWKFISCAGGRGDNIKNIRYLPFEDVATGLLAQRCGVVPTNADDDERLVSMWRTLWRSEARGEERMRTIHGMAKIGRDKLPTPDVAGRIVQHRIYDAWDMKQHHLHLQSIREDGQEEILKSSSADSPTTSSTLAAEKNLPQINNENQSLLALMTVRIGDEEQIARDVTWIEEDYSAVCNFHSTCQWSINVVATSEALLKSFQAASAKLPSNIKWHTRVYTGAFNRFAFIQAHVDEMMKYDLVLIKDNDQRITSMSWPAFIEKRADAVISAPLRRTLNSKCHEKRQVFRFHEACQYERSSRPDWSTNYGTVVPEVPFFEHYFALLDAKFANFFFNLALRDKLLNQVSDWGVSRPWCPAAKVWGHGRPGCYLVPLVSDHEDSRQITKEGKYDHSGYHAIRDLEADPIVGPWMEASSKWIDLIHNKDLHKVENGCRHLLGLGSNDPFDLQACLSQAGGLEIDSIQQSYDTIQLIENSLRDENSSRDKKRLTAAKNSLQKELVAAKNNGLPKQLVAKLHDQKLSESILVLMNVRIKDEDQLAREMRWIREDYSVVCAVHSSCQWNINVVVTNDALMRSFQAASSELSSSIKWYTSVSGKTFNKFIFVQKHTDEMLKYDLVLFKDNDQRVTSMSWRTFVEKASSAVVAGPLRGDVDLHCEEKSSNYTIFDACHYQRSSSPKWSSHLYDNAIPFEVNFLEMYFVLFDAKFANFFFNLALRDTFMNEVGNWGTDWAWCPAAKAWGNFRPGCYLVPVVSIHDDTKQITKNWEFKRKAQETLDKYKEDPIFGKWIHSYLEWAPLLNVTRVEGHCRSKLGLRSKDPFDLRACSMEAGKKIDAIQDSHNTLHLIGDALKEENSSHDKKRLTDAKNSLQRHLD